MGRRHEFGLPSRIVSRRRFQFLAFFKCHELPRILFERICQPSKVWNVEGEIVECSETIIGLDSDLENIFQEAKDNGIIRCFETLLSQTYVIDESWKQWLSFNTDDRARRNIQFNILELVLKAFPTPYTEISWMEVESQMLDIVQTTCVPFLCILDMKDVTDYLNDRDFDRAKMTRYLAILAKFLIRLSKLMGDSTPATIDPLISSCLEYLKEWPGVKSLHLARAINREQIENLDHCGINYLNGVIGLGLASILTSEESSHRYKHNHQIDWLPFETSSANSTIELLAQVELYGAISLATLQRVVYNDLPLTTRVLIAFSEVKLESYDNARNLLEPVLYEVKRIYGSQSMEVFLVGTTLVNCLNRCRMEALAEELVNSIFRKAVNQLEMPTTTQEFLIGLSTIPNHCTNSELSMVVAFADSLLGQGKHDDALSLFQAILKKGRPGREDITMSVALRITKIIRRLNIQSSTNDTQNLEHSDAWKVLRGVSELYPRVSSILKYAFVEEVICHLSLLEDKDTRQRFVASEIIKVLNLESTPYKGSESSRISFFENLQTINQYAEQLKSQLIKKEPESLTGKMTQRFSDTTVDLVEMISPHETQSITPKSTNNTAFHQALSPRTSRPGLTAAEEKAKAALRAASPDRPSQSSIDDYIRHLGIGWSKLSIDKDIQTMVCDWTKYIENHYPINNAIIRLQNRGLASYLIEAQEGYFLFGDDFKQSRLISTSLEKTFQNLQRSVPIFEGTTVLEASEISKEANSPVINAITNEYIEEMTIDRIPTISLPNYIEVEIDMN
ncbi:uncharacterized protein EAF02_003159 [Botrytis sinoallii]|uniref:uncharacterized protein n=1 Tax=Botrytis sinoallii TaxID=1463999 RepID=UPI001900B3B4|nr:uncharacterized protein EAF02_003159 [Botrytis sinoallii]KAF7888618.1 hypothetical protein EAF02_003159 [Botrytis sinoallii]